MAMAQHGTCSHQLPLSGLVQHRATRKISTLPAALSGLEPWRLASQALRLGGISVSAAMAASSSDQPRGPGTAPATALGVGEAAEAAAEAYVRLDLSANVCLNSIGKHLAEALTLEGIPFSRVRKQAKPGRHLNNFWYKARWGSLVSNCEMS